MGSNPLGVMCIHRNGLCAGRRKSERQNAEWPTTIAVLISSRDIITAPEKSRGKIKPFPPSISVDQVRKISKMSGSITATLHHKSAAPLVLYTLHIRWSGPRSETNTSGTVAAGRALYTAQLCQL